MPAEENERYHALEKLSPYLWRRVDKRGGALYLHWCEACGHAHTYPVGINGRPNWTFNNDVESPSFTPSMHIFIPAGPYGENEEMVPQRTTCHYYLTNGSIQYQGDCHHDNGYAGKTVPLKEIPDDYGF